MSISCAQWFCKIYFNREILIRGVEIIQVDSINAKSLLASLESGLDILSWVSN